MPEERVEELVRRFHEAFESRNVDEMLPVFAEDAVWVSPVGTFEGTEGLSRVLTWGTRISPTVRSEPSGIGVLVKGNIAVFETMSEGTLEDGATWDAPVVTIIECGDDEQIRRIRLYYDKLSTLQRAARQYTGVGGWVARRVIDAIVARERKACGSQFSGPLAPSW